MRIETPSIHSLKRLESSHSYLNHERIIIKRDLYLTFRSSVHPSSKGRRVKGFSERRKKLLRWSNNDVALIKKKKKFETNYTTPFYYIIIRKQSLERDLDRGIRELTPIRVSSFVSWKRRATDFPPPSRSLSWEKSLVISTTRLLNEFSKQISRVMETMIKKIFSERNRENNLEIF